MTRIVIDASQDAGQKNLPTFMWGGVKGYCLLTNAATLSLTRGATFIKTR